MSVHCVDLRTARHKTNGKKLIRNVCSMIESLDCEVAGFAVVVWADDGTAATVYETGGIVEEGGIAIYAHQKIRAVVEKENSLKPISV